MQILAGMWHVQTDEWRRQRRVWSDECAIHTVPTMCCIIGKFLFFSNASICFTLYHSLNINQIQPVTFFSPFRFFFSFVSLRMLLYAIVSTEYEWKCMHAITTHTHTITQSSTVYKSPIYPLHMGILNLVFMVSIHWARALGAWYSFVSHIYFNVENWRVRKIPNRPEIK